MATPNQPQLDRRYGQHHGQTHQRDVLSDAEVNLLLDLHGEGFSLRWLSEKFEIKYKTVWSIVSGRTRNQHPRMRTGRHRQATFA